MWPTLILKEGLGAASIGYLYIDVQNNLSG